MSFSKQLKARMQENNISQLQLAVKIGKGKSSVSQYLSGKNIPRKDVQAKIAEVLNCSVDDLHKPISDKRILTHKESRIAVIKKDLQEYVSVLPYSVLVILKPLVISLIAGIQIDETNLTLEEKEIILRAKMEVVRKG